MASGIAIVLAATGPRVAAGAALAPPEATRATAAAEPPPPPGTVGAGRHCRVRVELDPATGRIAGDASFLLPDLDRFLDRSGALPIRLDSRIRLDPGGAEGGAIAAEREGGGGPDASAPDAPRPEDDDAGTVRPGGAGAASAGEGGDDAGDDDRGIAHWSVRLAPAPGDGDPSPPVVSLRFAGVLRDDVEAGEAPGRIHNSRLRAHVSERGIYLAPEAAWHPLIDAARAHGWSGPDAPLCDWTLELAAPVPVVASGDRGPAGAAALGATTTRWTTPLPQSALAVAGGPLQASQREHEGVTIRTLLRPESAEQAPRLLAAVAAYLDLYQPLLGPYPYREFAVVESFFSSGFAHPGFTLLQSQVIAMGERGLRPGYLDHELLHGWWGHGVLASRRSGHWSEALASYCANYMRPVLEGRLEQARAQRRDVAETLSGNPALAGQAVGDFGLAAGVSSFVGYQKGAMVLAQLASRLGQQQLWAGLRRFYRDRRGLPSTWSDLRAALEAESGEDLGAFFAFWVDGPGLPSPRLHHAEWSDQELRVAVDYTDPVPIELPLRLRFDDDPPAAGRTERVTLHPGQLTLGIESRARPTAIEIDPEYETLRRLPAELLAPTLAGLAPPLDLVLVGGEDDRAGYAAARAAVEARYGHGGQVVSAPAFRPELLDRGHMLLLGRAALHPQVAPLFAADGVSLWDRGFEVSAVRYVSSGDAVLACIRNPRKADASVCLFWGNDDDALERADLLPFYSSSSLYLFDRGRAWKRRDSEGIERIEVR